MQSAIFHFSLALNSQKHTSLTILSASLHSYLIISMLYLLCATVREKYEEQKVNTALFMFVLHDGKRSASKSNSLIDVTLGFAGFRCLTAAVPSAGAG